MRGRKKIFTDDQIREAIALHDAGHTWRQAAEQLGISEPRLHNRASALLGRPYPSSLYRTIGKVRVSDYEFERMRAAQDNRCGICGKSPQRLVVDHCYKTGKIRGLLCLPCNAALGWVEKGGKTGWLKQALAYIRAARARPQYAEEDIERAVAAFRAGATYKAVAKTVMNRKGDKAITPTQLKRRIDEFEKRRIASAGQQAT